MQIKWGACSRWSFQKQFIITTTTIRIPNYLKNSYFKEILDELNVECLNFDADNYENDKEHGFPDRPFKLTYKLWSMTGAEK